VGTAAATFEFVDHALLDACDDLIGDTVDQRCFFARVVLRFVQAFGRVGDSRGPVVEVAAQ